MFNKSQDAEERFARIMMWSNPPMAIAFKAHQTKKFVKEHKKQIGTAVVVAAPVIFVGAVFKHLNDLEHSAPQS